MVEQYVNFYVIKGLIMHVKIFDHTFIIGNYKIIEYHNGKEISSFYSKVSLSPQDVKEYFDWLFIKANITFAVIQVDYLDFKITVLIFVFIQLFTSALLLIIIFISHMISVSSF